MRNIHRDRSDSSSSTITDPDNYDWATRTPNRTSSLELRNNDQQATMPPLAMNLDWGKLNNNANSGDSNRRPDLSPLKGSSSKLAVPQDTVLGESIDNIMMRLSNEFSPIIEKDADTLVYLGIPPQEPGQDLFDYDHIRNHFTRPYLMKSETLQRVNSSKFEKFLGPMSARTERRLKKQQVHKFVRNIDNIKYYIDLSPILSDEEAMTQLADMSVPKDALKWHQVANQYGVLGSQVAGRDTLNVPSKPYLASSSSPVQKNKKSEDEDSDDSEQFEGQTCKQKQKIVPTVPVHQLPLEEEYTSLRHHTTTSRLLHAIAGHDPKLNSAAKCWSFCMLAKYFDCAQSHIISPWVEGWLLQGRNSHFIQVNPYTAYRMALAMQSIWLVRCTFAILVGKRAMTAAISPTDPASLYDHTNGAFFNDLDDDEKNRIDHASATLYQRVKHAFEQTMLGMWMTNSEIVTFLNELQVSKQNDRELLNNIKEDLLRYVQRQICTASTDKADNDVTDEGDVIFASGSDINAYDELPLHLRVLTPHFWKCLRARNISMDAHTDLESFPQMIKLVNESGLMESTLKLEYVSKPELLNLIHKLNDARNSTHYVYSPFTSPSKARKTTEHISPTKPSKKTYLSFDSPEYPVTNAANLEEKDQLRDLSVSRAKHLLDGLKVAKAASTASPVEDTPTHSGYKLMDGTVDNLLWSMVSEFNEKSSERGIDEGLQSERYVQYENDHPKSTTNPFPNPIKPRFTLPDPSAGKQDAVSDLDPIDALLQAEEEMHRQSLPYRPAKRNSDAAELNEEFQRALEDQGAQTNLQRLPHRYQAKIADNGITPQTSADWKHEADQAQVMTFYPGETQNVQGCFSEALDNAGNRAYGNVKPMLPSWSSQQKQKKHFGDAHMSPNRHEPPATDIIYPKILLRSLDEGFKIAITPLITPGYKIDGTCDFDIPTSDVKTLLCLGEDEWKYLPLWAGGLDDGSGGVFSDGMEIPDAPDVEDGGFRGGAMGIIPGVGSSLGGSMSGSEFEDVATEVGISTVGKASRWATDGTATDTVVSLDE